MTPDCRFAIVCCLALCGCVVVDVPPSLPTVDVVIATDPCLCGDGFCDHAFSCAENPTNCPEDCGNCGNSVCDNYETNASCPNDCPFVCGDGHCSPTENWVACPTDCGEFCGDGLCDLAHGESYQNCGLDCAGSCANGLCEIGETYAACPQDCLDCGDGICMWTESTYTCPLDCGYCGDGQCDAWGGENALTCVPDCGAPDVVDTVNGDTWVGEVSGDASADTGPNCGAVFPYPLGCPCTADAQCGYAGYEFCVPAFWPGNPWGANGVCATQCAPSVSFNSCDPGFTCLPDNDYSTPYNVCMPQKAPCQPCNADSECLSGAKCLDFSGVAQAMNVPPQGFPQGKFCRAACTTEADCVDADTPNPACVAGRCVPSVTGCSCTAANAALGLSTDCTATVNGQACPGKATCGIDPAYGPTLLACEASPTGCP